MSGEARPGHVYLVGAGPGDADLLTVRAARLLGTATHVLPDGLISAEIVALAGAGATVMPVGKRCGAPRVTQGEINELLVRLAREGASIVRLKSGDPLIFGRAGEEMTALRAAGVPFEVVPGITAAFAAAAVLKTPLTDRASASKLILATAHYAAGKPWDAPDAQQTWSGALPADATLVLYMPGPDLGAVARQLMAGGMEPTTPAVAISRISSAEQRVHRAELGLLRTEDCGPAPVLLLLGRALEEA